MKSRLILDRPIQIRGDYSQRSWNRTLTTGNCPNWSFWGLWRGCLYISWVSRQFLDLSLQPSFLQPDRSKCPGKVWSSLFSTDTPSHMNTPSFQHPSKRSTNKKIAGQPIILSIARSHPNVFPFLGEWGSRNVLLTRFISRTEAHRHLHMGGVCLRVLAPIFWKPWPNLIASQYY